MSLSRFWQRMRSRQSPVARVVREPETWAGIDKQTAEPLLATTFKSLAPMAKALYPASGVLSVESLEATMRMLTFSDKPVQFVANRACKADRRRRHVSQRLYDIAKDDDNDDE